jgi:hypothetical protein
MKSVFPVRPSGAERLPQNRQLSSDAQSKHKPKHEVAKPTGVLSAPVFPPHRGVPITPRALIQSINADGRVSNANTEALNFLNTERNTEGMAAFTEYLTTQVERILAGNIEDVFASPELMSVVTFLNEHSGVLTSFFPDLAQTLHSLITGAADSESVALFNNLDNMGSQIAAELASNTSVSSMRPEYTPTTKYGVDSGRAIPAAIGVGDDGEVFAVTALQTSGAGANCGLAALAGVERGGVVSVPRDERERLIVALRENREDPRYKDLLLQDIADMCSNNIGSRDLPVTMLASLIAYETEHGVGTFVGSQNAYDCYVDHLDATKTTDDLTSNVVKAAALHKGLGVRIWTRFTASPGAGSDYDYKVRDEFNVGGGRPVVDILSNPGHFSRLKVKSFEGDDARLAGAIRARDVVPSRVSPRPRPVSRPKPTVKGSMVTSAIVDFDEQVTAIVDTLTDTQQQQVIDLRRQLNRFADSFLSYVETNTLSPLQVARYLSSIESYKQQLLDIVTPKPEVPGPSVVDAEASAADVASVVPASPVIISRPLGERIVQHITSSFEPEEQLRLLDSIAGTVAPERAGFYAGELPLLVPVLMEELSAVTCPEARGALARVSEDQQDDARRHFELSGCDPDRDSGKYDAEALKFQARLSDRLAAGSKMSCEGLYRYSSVDGSKAGAHDTRILFKPISDTEVEIKLVDRGGYQIAVDDQVYVPVVTVSRSELLGANGQRYFSEMFKLANRSLPSLEEAHESLHGATARFLTINSKRHEPLKAQNAPNCTWASREGEFTDRLGVDWLLIHRELIRILTEHYKEQREIDASSQLERLTARSAELDREILALVTRDMRAGHAVGDVLPAVDMGLSSPLIV